MRTANRIIEGFTFVAIGLIFLGSTLGYLSWSVGATFFALLSLWPVLLVSAGLEIIGRGLDTQWLRLLSSLVVLAAVLVGGLVLPATDMQTRWFPFYWPWNSSGTGDQAGSESFAFSKPRGNVTKATIVVRGGAGDVGIAAGDRDTLAAMSGESPFRNPFLAVTKTSAKAADVEASMGEGTTFFPFTGSSTLDVKLSPAVRWDVTVETGAASLEADLGGVSISSLTLKTGASSSEVTLRALPPNTGEVPVAVKAGAASVVIRVPEGAAVRVESRSGLSTVNTPEALNRDETASGRVYRTENWEDASARYAVRVEMGVGSFSIEQY